MPISPFSNTGSRFGSLILIQTPKTSAVSVVKDNEGSVFLAKAPSVSAFNPEEDLFELPVSKTQRESIKTLSKPGNRLATPNALTLLGVIQALRATKDSAKSASQTTTPLSDLFGGGHRPDLVRMKDQLIAFFRHQNVPEFHAGNVISGHDETEIFYLTSAPNAVKA